MASHLTSNRLTERYLEVPIVTRIYATLTVAVTLACQVNLVSPLHLFFNFHSIVHRREYWRIFTNFFFFGYFGIDFIFHLFFMSRYCRALEEGSFRGRRADFVWMILMCCLVLIALEPVLGTMFLGYSLNYTMVYIWSRRNPDIRMNFMGFMNFTAPYLPWVLMGLSLLLHGSIPTSEIIGVVIGHAYYFLDDVYPIMSGTGIRYLRAPQFFKRLIEPEARGIELRDETIPAVAANEIHGHQE